MISIDKRWLTPLINGMWSPFWVRNIELIRSSIKKMGLKPIDPEIFPVREISAPKGAMERELSEEIFRIRHWYGGIRSPHFHHAGEIYMLDREQWVKFGVVVTDGFKAKLERVNTVSFEQVIELDDAFAGLPL